MYLSVEHLPSPCKTLASILSMAKPEKNKIKKNPQSRISDKWYFIMNIGQIYKYLWFGVNQANLNNPE